MQDYLYNLAQHLQSSLKGAEEFLCSFMGEDSDFVRFNHNKIRQAGAVKQYYLDITLYRDNRHIAETITLCGDGDTDRSRISSTLASLRDALAFMDRDPYFLVSEQLCSTENKQPNRLPRTEEALHDITACGQGLDLVGIYAQGGMYSGFVNSLGQHNWSETFSFNFDWSVYHKEDKAVKCNYSGYSWERAALQSTIAEARDELAILAKPERTLTPGKYRAYLAPAALASLMEVLCWGGFSEKAMRTKNSPLIRMVDDSALLNPAITIRENVRDGIAPPFQAEGFIKADTVTLIENGEYRHSLVSPRTAKEYGLDTNGASAHEAPESLEMLPGSIKAAHILAELDSGVYINNLWYLNYSDRSACRMTGMTRFACFWVENGKIEAPIGVMRFDDTMYNLFGKNFIGLTDKQSLLIDPDTYGRRKSGSMRLPGVLVKDFSFTL